MSGVKKPFNASALLKQRSLASAEAWTLQNGKMLRQTRNAKPMMTGNAAFIQRALRSTEVDLIPEDEEGDPTTDPTIPEDEMPEQDNDGDLPPLVDDDAPNDGDLPPVDDDNSDLPPDDTPNDGDLPPVDEDTPNDGYLPPVDDGDDDVDVPEDGGDTPPVPSPPSDDKHCRWGPAYFCQTEEHFNVCNPNRKGEFTNVCQAIRDGMIEKCQDLGTPFWCSNSTAFNYCVASRGMDANLSTFAACKPYRIDGRKKCNKCGKSVTKIYNVHACSCNKPDSVQSQRR